MNMRILKSGFFLLAAIFIFVIYAVFVSFSEHQEYSLDSLLGNLLTPTELLELSEYCDNKPTFVYSAADGPKPTIVTMNCTITKKNFSKQINASGFQYIDELYQKQHVQIQTISSPSEDKLTSVTFIGSSSN